MPIRCPFVSSSLCLPLPNLSKSVGNVAVGGVSVRRMAIGHGHGRYGLASLSAGITLAQVLWIRIPLDPHGVPLGPRPDQHGEVPYRAPGGDQAGAVGKGKVGAGDVAHHPEVDAGAEGQHEPAGAVQPRPAAVRHGQVEHGDDEEGPEAEVEEERDLAARGHVVPELGAVDAPVLVC